MLREGCEVDAEQRVTYCFKTSRATCVKWLIFGIIFERIFAITIRTPCWCPALHGTLLGLFFLLCLNKGSAEGNDLGLPSIIIKHRRFEYLLPGSVCRISTAFLLFVSEYL